MPSFEYQMLDSLFERGLISWLPGITEFARETLATQICEVKKPLCRTIIGAYKPLQYLRYMLIYSSSSSVYFGNENHKVARYMSWYKDTNKSNEVC